MWALCSSSTSKYSSPLALDALDIHFLSSSSGEVGMGLSSIDYKPIVEPLQVGFDLSLPGCIILAVEKRDLAVVFRHGGVDVEVCVGEGLMVYGHCRVDSGSFGWVEGGKK